MFTVDLRFDRRTPDIQDGQGRLRPNSRVQGWDLRPYHRKHSQHSAQPFGPAGSECLGADLTADLLHLAPSTYHLL